MLKSTGTHCGAKGTAVILSYGVGVLRGDVPTLLVILRADLAFALAPRSLAAGRRTRISKVLGWGSRGGARECTFSSGFLPLGAERPRPSEAQRLVVPYGVLKYSFSSVVRKEAHPLQVCEVEFLRRCVRAGWRVVRVGRTPCRFMRALTTEPHLLIGRMASFMIFV